ncbi:MAG: efflux RND transporter periplasmic adaptor subunit [Acidobacteria bacterium]|nr:efflux RND transporter periplasmic adaptor subunit [Acidobacteriota bacterium]
MSETEIIENETRNRRPIVIAGLVALVLIVAGSILAWRFVAGGRAGQPVPAPRTVSFDDAGETKESFAAGQTVTVPADQLERSGIKIETVGEELAKESELAAAAGTVQSNSYRETPAIALVGGVVRRIGAELGDNVSKGQTIAVVFSSEFSEAQTRYLALSNEVSNARQNLERRRKLATINQPGRTEYDAALKSLKSAEAALDEMRKRFERTTKLVRIGAASREELEQDTTKLKTAEAEAVEAQNRAKRAESLLGISQETRSEIEEASNVLRNAESERASVRERLLLYGMSPARVDALRSISQITSEIAVTAPISGTVTSRTANPGEVVEANKELARVTDLSEVWVVAQVFEQQLPRLAVGSGASVTVEAFPDKLFRGRVAYIDPKLDEATRTAQVRVELANPERILKLGMYVRVAFGALGDAERTMPVVPASAVQNIGGRQIVFVATEDKSKFELRAVRLGPETNGRMTVLEGLQVGDRIVTEGSFMLRAEWQKTGN